MGYERNTVSELSSTESFPVRKTVFSKKRVEF